MMAMAVVAAACAVNAATIQWQTSKFFAPNSSSDLTFSTTTATKGSVTGYLFEYTTAEKAVWDSYVADLSKVYTDFKAGTLTTTINNTNNNMSRSINLNGVKDYGSSDAAYGIVLYTYNAGGSEVYIANYASVATVGPSPDAITELNTKLGGSLGSTAITGWTPTPEPTSGLLLLLGMAGLALKRKRA